MTDLLSRPSATSSSASTAPGRGGRLLGPLLGRLTGGPAAGERPVRPLAVSAALAAVGAAATGLVGSMVVALVGWFLADGGAHGRTTDALRIGADVWLVGHGSRIDLGGVPLGIVPLAVTALLAVVVHRFGRWAAAASEPTEDDRSVVLAATVLTGLYVVAAVLVCLVVGNADASPGLGRTIIGALLLAGIAGTLGLARGAGRTAAWVYRVPSWLRSIGYGAAATTLLLVLAAAALVAVSLVLHLNDASAVTSRLGLGTGDYVMYAVATIALAPNAVLLGAAYLLGPGFAVGTGTVVSPTVVSLAQVPAFPLLAALPGDGPTPSWAPGLMAVPVLVAVLGAVLAQRAYRVTAYDSAALRGFGCGFAAALACTALIGLAGGPMGTGRMADIGAPLSEVLVSAVAAMSLGGLVAGVATAWLQRRADHRLDV